MLWSKQLGKTHIPERKNTAAMPAVAMPTPKEVLIPMLQHIGAPATPIVKIGDLVKVGQKIGEAQGFVSSPVHASVSGKVTKIENYLRPDGKVVPAVRILSDGEMTVSESIAPPVVTDFDSFIAAIRESGLVGLGGAGFPTAVKLNALKGGTIDTIVVNCAECEPYITSDARTILDDFDYVTRGIDILLGHAVGEVKVIFAVEKNKPECIDKLKAHYAESDKVTVQGLPTKYPQGSEKVITYNTLGRIIEEGKLPSDVGVVVINVTTLAFIAKYMETGMPLVEKSFTVDGSAVKNPMNVRGPIGTPIRDIIEFVGGLTEEGGKVLYGGPMMGIAVSNIDEPLMKNNNAITCLSLKDSVEPPITDCIHCGRCVEACPIFLDPTAFAGALTLETREDRATTLMALKINLCMSCGCCSYVCPANRPLVQNNTLGKIEVQTYKAHLASLGEGK